MKQIIDYYLMQHHQLQQDEQNLQELNGIFEIE
jgi:hypothetical protein